MNREGFRYEKQNNDLIAKKKDQKNELSYQKAKYEGFNEAREKLPITKYSREIRETVSSNQTVIIMGETGSGKTTQIPIILMETMSAKDKIVVIQPRRVAVRSVARYVAEKVNCRIGDEVGYQVRFEDYTTEGTYINFMTDGILLRKIQQDPLLKDYSVVMVDEAHERSLNIDLTLGLLKRIQRKRIKVGLPPLKVIIASATLEKEKFFRYFEEAPMIEIPGRLHPVNIHYEKEPVYDYMKAAAEKVKEIVEQDKEGDILIFMPGQWEIEKTIKEIEKLEISNLVILPLYSQMSPDDQDRIFKKTSARKVIVSTNIAETSVTVPGIKYVIDSGLIKQTEFDSATGIEALVIRPHAKSGCIQRAGRAGRLMPGECWRLYTQEDFKERQEFQIPEIKRSNLAHVILIMKKIGIDDIESFEFIDPPKEQALKQAIETLKILGALDEKERITKIGEIMADLPLEPHISRIIVEAKKYKCIENVCTIAAFFGLRPVFVRPKGKEQEADTAHFRFKFPGSDFLTLLKIWQEYEANHFDDSWARENFLHSKVLNEVRQIRYQLFKILRQNGIEASESQDPEAIGKSITAGLIENLMAHHSRYSYYRVKDGKTGFYIHPSSVTFKDNPNFFVAARIVETKKVYAQIIQKVKPQWIREVAPQLTSEEALKPYYDQEADKIVQDVDIYLKGKKSFLMTEKREVKGKKAVEVFAEVLARGEIDMPFVEHNREIMETINDLWRRAEGKI